MESVDAEVLERVNRDCLALVDDVLADVGVHARALDAEVQRLMTTPAIAHGHAPGASVKGDAGAGSSNTHAGRLEALAATFPQHSKRDLELVLARHAAAAAAAPPSVVSWTLTLHAHHAAAGAPLADVV